MEVPVYEIKEKPMTVQEICSIFDNPDTDRISIVPPTRPNAGSIYLVTKTLDYLCDQYQWVNKGGQNVPRKNPIYFRRSYKCRRFAGDTVGDDKFQRFIYICNAKDMALIHYIGDESAHQDLPHGNAKLKQQPYKRTMPSTLNQIRSECTTKEPAHVYKESVVCICFGLPCGILHDKKVGKHHFEISKLRAHLIECLEKKELSEFPSKKAKGLRLKKKHKTVYDLDLDCEECRLPNLYDNMIECVEEGCESWAHYRCVPNDSIDYMCAKCKV